MIIISANAKKISTPEVIPLRHRLLKPHLAIEQCILPEDDLKTTFHIGIFYFENLVSVATFMMQPHSHFSAGFPYRLRGMATVEKYRGQGFGAMGLQHGILILKQMNCDFLWFNARIKAIGFYEKLGFQISGPDFEIPGIGPHKVMYKPLFPR